MISKASKWTQVVALIAIYGLVFAWFATLEWWPWWLVGGIVVVVLVIGIIAGWWRAETENPGHAAPKTGRGPKEK